MVYQNVAWSSHRNENRTELPDMNMSRYYFEKLHYVDHRRSSYVLLKWLERPYNGPSAMILVLQSTAETFTGSCEYDNSNEKEIDLKFDVSVKELSVVVADVVKG